VLPAARTCGSVLGLAVRFYIDHSMEVPGARYSFERVLAVVLERDPGSDDEILDGARRQHDA
jgi:hypothetical protein